METKLNLVEESSVGGVSLLIDVNDVSRLLKCSPRHIWRLADAKNTPTHVRKHVNYKKRLDKTVCRTENVIMAKVMIAPTAREQFKKLPRPIQARMLKLFERLAKWPNVSGAKPLRGRLAGCYRMRTGDYRLQFRVEGGHVVVVIVEKVGHRDGFYDENE